MPNMKSISPTVQKFLVNVKVDNRQGNRQDKNNIATDNSIRGHKNGVSKFKKSILYHHVKQTIHCILGSTLVYLVLGVLKSLYILLD